MKTCDLDITLTAAVFIRYFVVASAESFLWIVRAILWVEARLALWIKRRREVLGEYEKRGAS